jgi:hypothetical protein
MANRLQARGRGIAGRREAERVKIAKSEAARKIQNMYRNWKRYKIWQRTFRIQKIEEAEDLSALKVRFALALHSLCTRFTLALHSLYTRFTRALHSLCTRVTLALHALYTRFARALHALCTLCITLCV